MSIEKVEDVVQDSVEEVTETAIEAAEENAENKKEYLYTGKGDKTLVSDIMLAQRELNELKEQYGIQEEERGIKKAISDFFDRKDAQSQIPLKKKTYIWLAVLLGWAGAHRFYSKQYPTAILYLIMCWSGFSFAMTVVDLMIAIPKKPDENGNIYL